MLESTFGARKPIVGMVHFLPLPGSPLYDADGGMSRIVDHASADILALQSGGIDAVMFGNEGDRPYLLKATPESLAAMASAIGEVKHLIDRPFGVDYLWDPVASVALAVASGATFAREIFTGVYDSDMGLWAPDGAAALRLRSQSGREDLKLLFNINAEFASPVGTRTISERAASAVFSSLADIVLVSGPMTGQPAESGDLKLVKEALPDTPVFANTGVKIENVADVLKIADGAVVGTHFKKDGITWNAVDKERVARFMEKVVKLR